MNEAITLEAKQNYGGSARKFPKSLGYTEETKPKTHGIEGRVEIKVNGLEKFLVKL